MEELTGGRAMFLYHRGRMSVLVSPYDGHEALPPGEIDLTVMTGKDIDNIINSSDRRSKRLQLAQHKCQDIVSDTLTTFLMDVVRTDGRQLTLPEHLMNKISRECLEKEEQHHP